MARWAGLRMSARIASPPLPHATTSNPAFPAKRSITRSTGGSSSTTSRSGRAGVGLDAVMRRKAMAATREPEGTRPCL